VTDCLDALLSVGGESVTMQYEPGHLEAHADDFAVSWQELLDLIGSGLESSDERVGVVHEGFTQERVVGVTGVVAITSDDSSFWGCRPGRTAPSHLISGTKVPTKQLCIWGEWLAAHRFNLWTCYPGGPAPREIHDPDIAVDQLDESIAFWSAHAIVVDD